MAHTRAPSDSRPHADPPAYVAKPAYRSFSVFGSQIVKTAARSIPCAAFTRLSRLSAASVLVSVATTALLQSPGTAVAASTGNADRSCTPSLSTSSTAKSARLRRAAGLRERIKTTRHELAKRGGHTASKRRARRMLPELERRLACLERDLAHSRREKDSTAVAEAPDPSEQPRLAEVAQAPNSELPLLDTPTAEPPIEDPPISETPTSESPIGELPASEKPVQTAGPGRPPAKPRVPLSIAVHNNHLVNGYGTVVTLHGVNLDGTEWQCLYGQAFDSPSDEASIEAMVAWHINSVRIPLNEDCWLGINGAPTGIATYHEVLREYIHRLHDHGIYAILDLHWSAPGKTLSHDGSGRAGFYEMADEDHAPAFWESVASFFKTDHAVMFDLYNEPFGISWECWLSGCMAPRGFQTAGMQQLVDVVRSVGATQPIMVSGLKTGSEDGQEWITYHPVDPASQLVASVHAYDQRSIDYFNSNIGVVATSFPVVIGETGEFDCGDWDLNVLLPWADTHGVSYLAWAWYVGSCASEPSLISDYNGTPTAFGAGYRDHLLAHFPAPEPTA